MRSLQARLARSISLLQIGIAIAVIATVATGIAVNARSSQKLQNETAAISFMRSWITAQESYHKKTGKYAHKIKHLRQAGFLSVKDDDSHGYDFEFDNPGGHEYAWWGRGLPKVPGVTGDRAFYIDSRGVLRFTHGAYPNWNSPPLDGNGTSTTTPADDDSSGGGGGGGDDDSGGGDDDD